VDSPEFDNILSLDFPNNADCKLFYHEKGHGEATMTGPNAKQPVTDGVLVKKYNKVMQELLALKRPSEEFFNIFQAQVNRLGQEKDLDIEREATLERELATQKEKTDKSAMKYNYARMILECCEGKIRLVDEAGTAVNKHFSGLTLLAMQEPSTATTLPIGTTRQLLLPPTDLILTTSTFNCQQMF